jgi:ECF transporter S component (folate family)
MVEKGGVHLMILQKFSDSRAELKNLRTLTTAAILAALYAVSYYPFVGNIIIIPGVIEIRFGFLAVAVAAMLYGPVVAPLVAVIGDVLGTILFYGGSFFWGYTVSWLLQGIVFGLFFYKLRFSIPRTVGCMVFNTCVINLLLTTKWEEMMGFGTFTGLFAKRILHNVIVFPINILAVYVLLRSVAVLYTKLRGPQQIA